MLACNSIQAGSARLRTAPRSRWNITLMWLSESPLAFRQTPTPLAEPCAMPHILPHTVCTITGYSSALGSDVVAIGMANE
jgi:methyl coenzyme M reductase subunit C-like uncharacterized protein (methanogenesis marker protein 7)